MRDTKYLTLSGLEVLRVTPESNFINIGERTNVTGSRKFLRLIENNNYEEAIDIAREQVIGGAQIIDINMDEGMIDGVEAMTKFLNLIAADCIKIYNTLYCWLRYKVYSLLPQPWKPCANVCCYVHYVEIVYSVSKHHLQ